MPPPSGSVARPARRPGRVGRWLRRPTTAVALLGVAVVVGVVQGQPPPASRDSGVSVPVRESSASSPDTRSYTGAPGAMLVVVDGDLVVFDTAADRSEKIPLPRGLTALRAWRQDGVDLVLGRIANGRTVAYQLTAGRAPRYLGAAEVMVPSADGTAVWVVSRQVATRVPLAGGARVRVPLPPRSRLVGDTASGLVVSTGTVPDPVLPPSRRETPTPTVTSPAPTGTVSASAGGTPSVSGTGTPAAVPTTPPYTTASPVPSTGPDGVPLTTLVVDRDGGTRYLVGAEAIAAAGDVVLVRDEFRRLGVISPTPGSPGRLRLLPKLNAIEAIGPGTLDSRGRTFAVLGRTNDYAWLMVGPTSAETNGAINVVALDGGAPVPGAAAPAFTASGRVLTVRPDGRIVYYAPGERDGFTLADALPPATAVAQA